MSTKINSLFPSDRTKDIIKQLELMGYYFAHQKGSHITYKKANCASLTLVDCKVQSVGTLRNIAKLIPEFNYYG